MYIIERNPYTLFYDFRVITIYINDKGKEVKIEMAGAKSVRHGKKIIKKLMKEDAAIREFNKG